MKGCPEMNKKGFTFVEIMVVASIIGLLSASQAVPSYLKYRDRAVTGLCGKARSLIEQSEQRYFFDKGVHSASIQDLVEAGYIKSLPVCPGHGVYAWKPAEEGQDDYHSFIVCSLHGQEDTHVAETLDTLFGWSMEEGAGNKIGSGDFLGYFYGAEWAEGKIGKGIKFDDAKDYLVIDPSGAVQFKGDMSVSMWIKPDSMPGKKNESLFTCAGKSENEKDNTLYELTMDSKGNLFYSHEYDKGSDQSYTFSNTGIESGEWSLVTLSRDTAAKKVEVYVNGKIVDT
ncbi:MAG: LamG-like jellyroll fold domain-containing protein, partial [Candidatus Omnitrophota bacterium]